MKLSIPTYSNKRVCCFQLPLLNATYEDICHCLIHKTHEIHAEYIIRLLPDRTFVETVSSDEPKIAKGIGIKQ